MRVYLKPVAISVLVVSLMTGCDANDNQDREPQIEITQPVLGARLSTGELFPVKARITSNQVINNVYVGLYYSKISSRDTHPSLCRTDQR